MIQRLDDEDWEEGRKQYYRNNIDQYAEAYLTNEENRKRINKEIELRKETYPNSIKI